MGARIDTLRNLIAQDPSNSRFRYMLAMELLSSGDPGGAAGVFAELIELDPAYVAAYFHCGQAQERLGDLEQARRAYARGIEVASAAGDEHTRAELQQALDLLL